MIGVSEYIRNNYTEYTGDAGFLVGATERTKKLMKIVEDAVSVERRHNGVLDIDTATVATITAYSPGYIDKHNELIVGLQTDSLLKRALVPFGGLNMVKASCGAYNRKVSPEVLAKFEHRVTHNEGVFRMYTDEMKTARKAGVLTGLPDSYGRGRIIGDYRRVALFGVDSLIEAKQAYKKSMADKSMGINEAMLLEETYVQIQALQDLKNMAKSYGYDISKPAATAREAIQWLYFAYLGAIKEQNGAAMSLGRVSTFLDIYIEKDMQAGLLDEVGAQELIDDFVLKLRVARHLRTPEYNELFGGDPMWITEAVGGMREDGVGSLVTKTSFRLLNTLYTLGESPEPNLTVLWSDKLPKGFKEYCAKVSIDTCALQYENDDLMRPEFGDDYAISCCVSAMRVGKDMQFFGARLNLPKLLLLALNGGYDTDSKLQVGPKGEVYRKEVLEYKEIDALYSMYRDWAAKLYVNTMNLIHISHDKYAYEGLEMALHDDDPHRYMAFGLAGVSVFADSMSAIKHAEVKPLYNEAGYIVDFVVTGRYPLYGNDDDRVDLMLRDYVGQFYSALTSHKTYRDAEHTLSLLTITSNVMYGRKTGNTPDGRRAGEAYAPGANPMPNREREGALSSLNSVAKLDYCNCKDGISNTFSLLPATLGATDSCRVANLVTVLDGYFENKGHHLNVNVLNRGKLLAAYTNPDMHPNLTIRVSGYAVDFHKLSKEHQLEVIQRTYHEVF